MASQNESASYFAANKYWVQREFLSPELAIVAHRYAVMKAETGEARGKGENYPDTPSMYGDTLMETLMDLLTPRMEGITGLQLFPTYSFFRVYRPGDELKAHADRPACEVSVTVCLGYDYGSPAGNEQVWPIYIDNSMDFRAHAEEATRTPGPDDGIAVSLRPGDAMIYRGREVKHWRWPFTGKHQAQVFIHYVDQNGPYATCKFDERPRLGLRGKQD